MVADKCLPYFKFYFLIIENKKVMVAILTGDSPRCIFGNEPICRRHHQQRHPLYRKKEKMNLEMLNISNKCKEMKRH